MTAPTPSEIQAAYEIVAAAEKAAVTSVKSKAAALATALDNAISGLPYNGMPQTPGLASLFSWQQQIQAIVQAISNLDSQYPDPNVGSGS